MLSRHAKAGEAGRRSDLDRVDIVNASAGGPASHCHLETLHRVDVAFRDDLYGAVVLIAHVSLNTFALRCILDEVPEPDALHAALHDVPPPHEHAELYRGIVGIVGGVGIVGIVRGVGIAGTKKKGASPEAGALVGP